MAEVFLCERGQINERDRRALGKAGVVVVEADDPSKCQFIRSTETIGSDDMLWAALDALCRSQGGYGDKADKQREQLAHNIFSLIVNERRQRGAFLPGPRVPDA